MELANKENLQDECAAMAIIQGCALYNQGFRGPSLIHTSSNSSPENHIYGVYRDPEKAAKNFTVMSNSSRVSSPSITNSNGLILAYQPSDYSVAEESNSVSVAAFNSNLIHVVNAGSLQRSLVDPKMISEEDDYPIWEGDHQLQYQIQRQMNSANHGPPGTSSSHHAAGEHWAWLNDQDENGVHKRPSTGKALQALKKQCVAASSKKPKPKVAAECKDPQSVAAKNRRERISERLKTLQELVPNGSKVDLVTMLEKAISYVKFLQLQVTVLATDEFWAVEGGKAPDISQVRQAIDVILADLSSSSKSDQNQAAYH